MVDRLQSYISGAATTPEQQKDVRQEAESVAADPRATEADKLRARAILASQVENPTAEQAQTAYQLWQALAVLQVHNASAHFNAGYWAQGLYEQKAAPSPNHWLSQAQTHYQQALKLKPNMHGAAYNWGIALVSEAQALSEAGDLQSARAKWQAAGAQFERALAIKPNKHEAVYNWGLALRDEAQALSKAGDLQSARAKWQAAGAQFERALAIKPNKHEAANNWGNALADEAQALSEAGDLQTARAKWQAAGAQFERALAIKPNKHEAAYNWGLVLRDEARVVKSTHPQAAQALLAQAQALLERHAQMDELGQKVVAYNLACVYALQGQAALAVAQLEVSRQAGELPGRAHIERDPDLDPIRATPEFQGWWRRHFS